MSYSIERCAGLTDQHLAHIRQLETACNAHEGLTVKLNWQTLTHRAGEVCNDFFYYQAGEPAAYLALYAFNPREAEVSAMTLPTSRQQGLFRRLLVEAGRELRARNIPSLLFICEQKSASAKATMTALGAVYEFSEYKMTLTEAVAPPTTDLFLTMRPAEEADIPVLARLDELCFHIPYETNVQRYIEHFMHRERDAELIEVAGEVVGKINIGLGEREIYIAGFGMYPDQRGRGYGRLALTRTLQSLLPTDRPIVLEVATENPHALHLYQDSGFVVTTAYDYYRLPVAHE